MVARGEFAYMVAETAQAADYLEGEPGQKMMSPKVYASVVWSLVMATVASPILFHWALGVYGRATPIIRSRTIGGTGIANEEADENKHQGRGFVIRVASKHHIGVQRELLACLHGAGVDVIEAHVYGVDHPSTDEVDAFVAMYVVTSRGKKKDFDDEKLEEMAHQLGEVLDDADAQVIFEPHDDDFSKDGALEIQVFVQHHPDVLHEITDALAEMGLDVFKADVTHTLQPAHGHTDIDTEGGRRASVSRSSSFARPTRGERSPSKSSAEIEADAAAAAALDEEARERALLSSAAGDGSVFYSIEDKETAIFYAREADGTHQFSATRRMSIKEALEKIFHDHSLHGTVMVRAVHESQMTLAHKLPKFEHEENLLVVKCTGAHHKELLHEICDTLHASELDVVHAEMDTNPQGLEEHVLYTSRRDGRLTSREQRTSLRLAINALYETHGKDMFSVSLLPLRGGTEESLLSETLHSKETAGPNSPSQTEHPLTERTTFGTRKLAKEIATMQLPMSSVEVQVEVVPDAPAARAADTTEYTAQVVHRSSFEAIV